MLVDLPSLIMQFRTGVVAMSADIARAFLSVQLAEKDRRYVRFLWYKDNDPSKGIVPYQHNTVIFGSTASPFTLAAVLSKHFDAHRDSWVAQDMGMKLYVDNLLSTLSKEDQVSEYFEEAMEIMQRGNFRLRQWASNSQLLMKKATNRDIHVRDTTSVPLLGMTWNADNDVITIARKSMTQTEATITKRKVASRTAALFDPLGLVAPVTVTAKVFINKLWQSSKEWDQELDQSELKEWSIIHSNLNQTHQIEFPRWLGFDNESPIKLMVFCDAAPNSAVGCVIYGKQGNKIRLIGSKNKVISKAKAG
ncbi:uncharacterized protein LOC141914575 [Tubulanus polymorphus]|uniref:uncharacterized protein LOC141914575 n=1 Tax=Tubulanus polymorphus TaxID=672921 RepID=UPI003DA23142